MRMSVLLVLALLVPAAAQEPPSKDEVPAKRVRELQKQRIALLKEAADVSMNLVQRARVELWEAVEDRMALLQAELDAAETAAERLALYKGTVDLLKQYEAMAKARAEHGRATELSGLRIRARRLGVEIQWERAKEKAAKGPG